MCSTVHSGYMKITRRFDALDDWIRSLTISAGKLHQRNMQDVGPVGPAGEGMVALDAALAGLGIGRKFCRQLRAELRLEDVTQQPSNMWRDV